MTQPGPKPSAPKTAAPEPIIELVEVMPWGWIVIALVLGVTVGAVVVALFTETTNDA